MAPEILTAIKNEVMGLSSNGCRQLRLRARSTLCIGAVCQIHVWPEVTLTPLLFLEPSKHRDCRILAVSKILGFRSPIQDLGQIDCLWAQRPKFTTHHNIYQLHRLPGYQGFQLNQAYISVL
ncbi:hypothetical protein H4Q26_005249 [Puccinia striiformis f. sp. tritici PST-130]|nr:hypothetical protein H4Q26_005249 [Puccinia striiformis f. sp. tritici PST-130]